MIRKGWRTAFISSILFNQLQSITKTSLQLAQLLPIDKI
jgi:hypothetical protein